MSERSERQARVALRPRSIRSLRWSLGVTRWVLYVTAAVGVAATVRFALAPPAPRITVTRPGPPEALGGEWLAERFASAYLSWGTDLAAREQRLAPFLAADDDPSAGVRPAPGSEQQAASLGVAAVERDSGAVEYTVAVQVDPGGLRYLAVDVARTAAGRYVVAHYPAMVAAPAFARAGALDGTSLPAVTNHALEAVLARALGNYLSGSGENLSADLVAGTRVRAPAPSLELAGVQRLAVEPSGAVLATVTAQDTQGDVYTLDYTLGVVLVSGRWEISSIDPTTT
jgi:hypothetical protein